MGLPLVNPGSWLLLPGSIESALWTETIAGANFGKTVDEIYGIQGTSSAKTAAMAAWNSALLDELRGEFVALEQGGHASTRDNESHAFKLSGKAVPGTDAALPLNGGAQAWSRIHNPSPISQLNLSPPPDFYSDGVSATTHNYGGIQHMLGINGEIDKYWMCGGNKWPGDGPAFTSVGIFDRATGLWTQGDTAFPPMSIPNSIASAWDPFHLRVLVSTSDLWAYYPLRSAGQQWVQLTNDGIQKGGPDYCGTAFFDKRRSRFYMVGAFLHSGLTGLMYYQLNPQTGAAVLGGASDPNPGRYLQVAPISMASFPTLADPWYYWRSPGGLYDEISDDIVIYNGGPVASGGTSRAMLFRVNPETWAVTLETSTNSPSESIRSGTYNKLRHFISEDVYVMSVSATEGVWAYRPNREFSMVLPEKYWTGWECLTGRSKFDPVKGASYPGGKHSHVLVDGPEIVLAGGDIHWSNTDGNSNPWVGALDVGAANPSWRTIDPVCGAAETLKPMWPDNVPWVHDTKRHLYYMFRGYYIQTSYETACPGGATATFADMTLDPTTSPGTWSVSPWAVSPFTPPGFAFDAGGATHNGVYHKATDSVYFVLTGGTCVRLDVATRNWVGYKLGAFDHGNGETALAGDDIRRQLMTIDEAGWMIYLYNSTRGKLVQLDIRKMYALAGANPANGALVTAGAIGISGNDYCRMFTFPGWIFNTGADHDHGSPAFDNLNRRVLCPLTGGMSGEVYKFYAFNPIDATMEELGTTSEEFPGQYTAGSFIQGNWGAYLDVYNVLVLGDGKSQVGRASEPDSVGFATNPDLTVPAPLATMPRYRYRGGPNFAAPDNSGLATLEVVAMPFTGKDLIIPVAGSTLVATYYGLQGDYSQTFQAPPGQDGLLDNHFVLSGLRGDPSAIRILGYSIPSGLLNEIWWTPITGQNWILAKVYHGDNTADVWGSTYSPAGTISFDVTVFYPDGSQDNTTAVTASEQQPVVLDVLSSPFVGQTLTPQEVLTMAWVPYDSFKLRQFNGNDIDFDTETIKLLICTATYSPNRATDDFRNDVTNEVSGTGYTAGGIGIGTVSLAVASNVLKFDCPDITIAQSGSGFTTGRILVLACIRGGASSADPLIAYYDMGADKGNVAGDLVLQTPNGIFTF